MNSPELSPEGTKEATADRVRSLGATGPFDPPAPEGGPWHFPGGRYRVVGEIARGGMGVVLRAQDVGLDRPLAIKVMLPRADPAAGVERRFLEEASITGQLQHPGVPPVHEVGRSADGRPFFSMKLIEGRTLADLLGERPTPQTDLPRFLKVFEQIAQTLAYAHSRGILHRDLKPLNVMVGAFGEVQVMDWGLAKRLPRERPAALSMNAPDVPAAAPEDTAAAEPDTGGSHTQAGQVLGTFAYMAPEQARGEVAALDERCDVFGLGAILCTILTGQPPYRGRDAAALCRQAREADLADAWSRLGGCGADAELMQLARACLAPDKEARPRDAGEVAGAVARHLASVQERLQQTRVARAEAEVRAREERKRRRLAVGLAGAVILLVAGAAAGGLWYVHDQGRRAAQAGARRDYLEREIAAALEEAERQRRELQGRLRDPRQGAQLLSNLGQWREELASAQAAWRRADRLAAGDPELLSPELRGRLEALAAQLEADEGQRDLAVELDRIRLEATNPVGGEIALWRAAPKLQKAFQGAGYDFTQGNPAELAERLRDSPIRLPLVGALDFWALVTRNAVLRRRLLEVARRADPDPWRDRLREAESWRDLGHLQALADEADFAGQSPQILAALAQRLRTAGGDATPLLSRALVDHPRDFWLSFELGHASKDVVEQVGAFRAALSVRPDSPYAYYAMGVTHYSQRKLAEALACYRKAVELDEDYAPAHNNLGMVLSDLNKPDEALAHYRKAVELDPTSSSAQTNLGALLYAQNKLDEALAHCRRAVEIDPRSASALINLGVVLRQQGKLDEAVACFRRAIDASPGNPYAWGNLGHALSQQGKFGEALAALKRAHELGSGRKDWSHPSARWVQETELLLALDEKLPAVLEGKATPAGGRESLALGQLCVMHKKRFAAAARFYAAALDELKLPEGPSDHRYNAACAAALAAAGKGIDGDRLTDGERAEFRKRALGWLRADLAAWAGVLAKVPQNAGKAASSLRHWQTDPDLAGVREEEALARFPSDERQVWQQFWVEVAAVRRRAEMGLP